jgi:type I restriction enzyme M protein
MIVEMVDPQPGERICDPACGTAGFLIAAFQHILRARTSKSDLVKDHVSGDRLKPADWKFLEERAFTGFDNDANMVKIAILNLYLHQLEKADIEFYNPLTTGKGGAYPGVAYDIILTNPPSAGSIQQESILSDLNHGINTRDTELLFLKWFIDHLTKDGRAGVIVPNGVLFGSTNAATKLRQMLLKECDLQAVVSLPSGVFKPYSGVGTAVLIFKKGKATQNVWFYDLTADGFSLSDTRTPVDDNDIPDLLSKWTTREPSKNSFLVPIRDIEAKKYELLPARYRQQRIETSHHDDPTKIIDEVLTLEDDISKRVRRLREKLQIK